MKILPYLEQSTQTTGITTDRTPLLENSYRSSMFDNFLYSSDGAAESVYQPVQQAIAEIRSAPEEVVRREDVRSASENLESAARDVSLESVKKEPQDLQVSREDWNKIKDELKKYGVDKKDIADLEEKVMSEGGITYGVLVTELSSMMQSQKGVTLTPVQKQNMDSIFAKLGFNPDESKNMLADISKGKMGDVLKKMQDKLTALSDSQDLQFSEDETKTLSLLFKLSDENSSKVAQFFTKEGATAGVIKQGFSLLKDALVEQSAKQDAKDLNLVKTVASSLQKAMDQASDQSPDNVRMASAKVISDSLGVGKEIGEKTASNTAASQGEAGDSAITNKNSADHSTDKNSANTTHSSENKSNNGLNNQAKGGFEGNPQNNPQHNNSAASDTKYTNKHWLENILSDSKDVGTWNNFFGKLTDSSITKSESSILGDALGGGGVLGTLKNAANAAQSGKATGMWEQTARSNVLEQVQQGAFKNLGQGTKQLTLKLNPLDLGTVNVMIQVHNKDVKAVIRADNPDTARMIADQLESVKHALEQQGLKVDKLEVQTGLADSQTQSSWNGAQDHNTAHYQEMMAGMKKRWHDLRSGGTSLAQDVQNIEHTATISQSGLHVVA
ncbi:flagellar hook-length control protein FliK [Desulfovibrio gilichinskyi]|uniref:Flagellar hook-length control protein FliK n=1 Tax=Desulfovibrio gilichinskyi TaxID=1519643 RepID=A0A1X7DNS5_9BACT|nr:flagellar hook-length control protein FliK [Desulfovibrio gilichinskyi]SMF18516.1 flagellar hook-length control protein FliK [Desulfovibrio gilichinskyi]